MFAMTRWSPFEGAFNFQREVDRLFNQFWSDLPPRTSAAWSPAFRVNTTENGWHVDVPLAGIDPQHIALETSGNTITIRVEQPKSGENADGRYEQTITVPQFLDVEQGTASHRHGMLRLTVPVKESIRP